MFLPSSKRSPAGIRPRRRPVLEELECRLTPSLSPTRPPSFGGATGTPPVAADDNANTVDGLAVAIDVLNNDYDPDGSLNPSSVALVQYPAHGLASVDSVSGQIVYFPTPSYIGGDAFTYTVRDNSGLVSNIARVATANGPGGGVGPVAFNDSGFTTNGQAVTIDVLDNDFVFPGTVVPSSVTVTSAPNHGSVSVNPISGAITYTPGYPYVGADTFTYTFMDSDGATSSPGTVAIVMDPLAPFVQADPLGPGTVLSIDGTALNDDIRVAIDGATGLIDVRINGASSGPYVATGRVVIYGYGGDDNLQVSGVSGLSVWEFGGPGNDTLLCSGSACLLVGGDGDDSLTARKAPSILIGGAGGDRLNGGASDDLLIAGATDFDQDEQALIAIFSEWTSPRDDSSRIDNLTGVDNPTFADRKNGDYYLTADTVHDDGRLDLLTGSGGQDFAFAHLADGVVDWVTDFNGLQHKAEAVLAI